MYSHTRDYCLDFRVTHPKRIILNQRGTITLFSTDPDTKVQEITLSELLETVKLSIEAKRVIGLVLARTVLHLLGSKWVISPESLDNVSFYFTETDKDGKPLFHFDRPFMSTKFQVPSDATSESSDDLSNSPFGGLWALGMALGKIELGEEYSWIDREIFSRLRANPTAVQKSLVEQCKRYSALPPTAIEFCFGESLSDFEGCSREELLKDRGFIDRYYNGVIRPFEGWLIKNHWSWKEVNRLQTCGMDQGGICYLIRDINSDNSDPASRPSQQRKYRPTLSLNPIHEPDEEVRVLWSGQPPGRVMDYMTSYSNRM